jgi:hypothetical protein
VAERDHAAEARDQIEGQDQKTEDQDLDQDFEAEIPGGEGLHEGGDGKD